MTAVNEGKNTGFPCACRFVRADKFAEVQQIEECARHSTLRRRSENLDRILGECATAVVAVLTPQASLELKAQLPEEIRAVLARTVSTGPIPPL